MPRNAAFFCPKPVYGEYLKDYAMMTPKAFRIEDYKARALHDYALQANKSDGELLREIVSRYLEERGYDPYDYIAPLSAPNSPPR